MKEEKFYRLPDIMKALRKEFNTDFRKEPTTYSEWLLANYGSHVIGKKPNTLIKYGLVGHYRDYVEEQDSIITYDEWLLATY